MWKLEKFERCSGTEMIMREYLQDDSQNTSQKRIHQNHYVSLGFPARISDSCQAGELGSALGRMPTQLGHAVPLEQKSGLS